jgi:hypothetical protein
MARQVFYSFDFKEDSHRVSQVKQMGVIEGQPILSSNQWEEVKKGGDAAIEAWIAKEMAGKTCLVVLIGKGTAGRKWVDYEIKKAWNDKKGVLGVYIHGLKNLSELQSVKGANPFTGITIGTAGQKMSSVVKAHDTPYSISTYVYDHIKSNLSAWVEEAIQIRKSYTG